MFTRDQHAATIANASSQWKKFEALHREAFGDEGKYIVVDGEGKKLQRFATNAEAKDALPKITNAATVRHEDFLTIKDQIIEVRRRKLNGIADLMAAGLSFSEDIRKTLVGFETVNEFSDAEQGMNPNVTGNDDTVFTEQYSPLPITHKGFSVPWRQQGFDYKRSLGMSESIRQVTEKLERTLFLGNTNISVSYGGSNHPLYGYTTHPNRGTATISNWAASANIGVIHTELNRELGNMWKSQGGLEDQVCVYVANDIWQNLQEDYKAESSDTVMERCMRIPQVSSIKKAEYLADGDVVLVEMLPRTIQLAVASDIIAVPHTKTDAFMPQAYTTYAAMTHCIKSDSKGNTGIRHLSKS